MGIGSPTNTTGNGLVIGGVPVTELVQRTGTPLYVYDAETVRGRYGRLVDSIEHRPLRVLYSCKANPVVGLVALLHDLGAGVDVCSPGDVAVARAAGVPDAEMSYVGHGIDDLELAEIARSPMVFIADSLSQVSRVGRLAPGRDIGIRINPGIVAGFHPHVQAGAAGSKFGIPPDRLADALELAGKGNLRVVGLHAHIGSDILDASPHIELLHRLIELISMIPDARFVNLGGGWGVPFDDTDEEYDLGVLGAAVDEAMRSAEQHLGRSLELRIEPGAYLVMDAGVLIMRVVETRERGSGEPGAAIVACTDSSYNHVISAVLYGNRRRIHVDGTVSERPVRRHTITGNLMQAGDVLARDMELPALVAGDVLVMENCGAYASSRSTAFNQRPRPAEVLVDGGEALLMRRRETIADLLSRDMRPDRIEPVMRDGEEHGR